MNDQLPQIIQVDDSTLDAATIIARVQEAVAQRRAAGSYGPDPASAGPESLRPGRYHSPEDLALGEFPGLDNSLAELAAEARLCEPKFSSGLPYLGRLVVVMRRAWNWMSTKWYVLPILRQQSEVNINTARVISDLAQWHELDARRIHQLENRVAELEARLRDSEPRGQS